MSSPSSSTRSVGIASPMSISSSSSSSTSRISIEQEIHETTPRTNDFTTKYTIEEQRRLHKGAKLFMEETLRGIGAKVTFISPPQLPYPKLESVEITKNLDRKIFSAELTTKIEENIQADAQRIDKSIVIYGVASKYNCGVSEQIEPVVPGKAFHVLCEETSYTRKYDDFTYGLIVQLQFGPKQVELVNCAAHKGFNGLAFVLEEETKGAVINGVFHPTNEAQRAWVIHQLQHQGHRLEMPCIVKEPWIAGVKRPIHIILSAAPDFKEKSTDPSHQAQENEIQFLCALLNYRAQFNHVIQVAQMTSQSVIFKPMAIGLGERKNDPLILAKAFYTVVREYISELQNYHVHVKLQVMNSPDAKQMASYLKLNT